MTPKRKKPKRSKLYEDLVAGLNEARAFMRGEIQLPVLTVRKVVGKTVTGQKRLERYKPSLAPRRRRRARK